MRTASTEMKEGARGALLFRRPARSRSLRISRLSEPAITSPALISTTVAPSRPQLRYQVTEPLATKTVSSHDCSSSPRPFCASTLRR